MILSSEIIYEKLNLTKDNQSPQASSIWHYRNGITATRLIDKFVNGFLHPTYS